MSRGGAREGAGRKAAPSKQIRVNIEVFKELNKVSGKTYTDKIEYLLKSYNQIK